MIGKRYKLPYRRLRAAGTGLLAIASLLFLTSCFTGVEGTRRVVMGKSDVAAIQPGEEDRFINRIQGIPLAEWQPGKEFIVLDNRAVLIFDPQTLPSNPISLGLRGDTLRFEKSIQQITPGLDTLTVLLFSDRGRSYRLPLKQSSVNSMELPMLADAAILHRLDTMLAGRTLWVRNPLWHATDSTTVRGLKYGAVKVDKVLPGINVYPARIHFTADSLSGWLPVSLPGAGPAAFSFSQQFSLTDPRTRYPAISDQNWALIQKQQVSIGMTKDEVRLALGTPKDILQVHNSALLYELWQYSDGSYLMFEDGLLQETGIRR